MINRQSSAEIFADVAPTVRFDEPLARHTTWRIGGLADIFVVPTAPQQVSETISRALAAGVPYYILGRGSNLLVKDGGIRGVVIKLGDEFADLRIDGQQLVSQSGRGIMSAANIAIRHGLSGLEFATSIPGTVGGAVTMNAGAHGGEVKDVLDTATVLTAEGELRTVTRDELQYAYRFSIIRERQWVVLSATFSLQTGDVQEMQERVRAWSKHRSSTQPLSLPNCGSVFRNPQGDHAARLIEAAGLKGTRVGNAAVSDLHANFIVNLGSARAEDVLQLILYVQKTVEKQCGVLLVPEVRVVGEDETRG